MPASLLPSLLKFTHLCRSFLTSRNGNVAVIFGVAAVPLFGALGAALDYSRINRTQSTLQSAMDAAVLAGLTATSGNEIATATRIFAANFNDPDTTLGAPSYTLDTSCGCLTGTVSGTIRMTIMGMVGISTMPV